MHRRQGIRRFAAPLLALAILGSVVAMAAPALADISQFRLVSLCTDVDDFDAGLRTWRVDNGSGAAATITLRNQTTGQSVTETVGTGQNVVNAPASSTGPNTTILTVEGQQGQIVKASNNRVCASLNGNAVCDPAAKQTTITWTLENNDPSASANVTGTNPTGASFSPLPVPPQGSATATEVVPGPATPGTRTLEVSVNVGGIGTSPDATVNLSACQGTIPPQLSFTFTKTADRTTAEVGDTITYTYAGRNTSSVPLEVVRLVDDRLGIFLERPERTIVQPGASISEQVTYVVRSTDAGTTVVNNAVVTVQDPDDPSISGQGTASASVTVADLPNDPVVIRVDGPDRIGTAVDSSRTAFPNAGSARAAVLARSDLFPDALAGVPLAVAKQGPLLLTTPDALSPATERELQRVLPSGSTVYVLGGEAAVSTAVAARVQSLGYTVVRFAGTDRYETAVLISRDGLGAPSVYLLASGIDFPDALSAGAAAARQSGGVVLSAGTALPEVTAAYLASRAGATVTAIGGPAAAALPTAPSVVGADRYETAVRTAERFFTAPPVAGIASGVTFPDGLTGGAVVGRFGGPMLLTNPAVLPAVVGTYLRSVRTTLAITIVFGGPAAVSDGVEAQVEATLRA